MIKFDKVASFQRREAGNDGAGNHVLGAFVEVFREWVGLNIKIGGEGVLAARLTGQQPAILTVRATAAANEIDVGWIALIGGVSWNVKEPPRLTADRSDLEMLVDRGRGDA